MKIERSDPCFFKSVEPMAGRRLHLNTRRGDEFLFDFTPCLGMTRFADLKNEELFNSVSTDGSNIIFRTSGIMPIILSASALFELMAKVPSNDLPAAP